MGRNVVVQVRSVVQVGEMQFDGRTGGVMVMNAAIRVKSVVWVRQIQLGRRTSRGDGDECGSLGEVSGMDRGDAARQEDRWGDGHECNNSGEVNGMGRTKGGGRWIVAQGEQ